MELLQRVDTLLFFWINTGLANPVTDLLMPVITNKWSWLPVWIMVIGGILWKGGRRDRRILLVAVLSVVSADLFAFRVMKKNIDRVRPCNALDNVHLLVRKSTSNSMPSNHAANFFALAMAFGYYYRRYRGLLFGMAALVGLSRIFVGVHYPFDVVVGALVGVIWALFWIHLFKRTGILPWKMEKA